MFDPGLCPPWGARAACDATQLLFTLKQLLENLPAKGSCTYRLCLGAVRAFP